MSDRPDMRMFPDRGAGDGPPSAEEPAADRTRLVGQEEPGGVPMVYVARGVLEFVESCARRAGQEGAAGFLMGRALRNPRGRRFVLIDGCVEGPEVEAAARSVKLTPNAWKSLRAAASRCFEGQEVVGWFHARPGEPMQLSPYETFVHQTHFGAPWQVALVLDPASGEMAWWGWDGQALERARGFRVWEAPPSALLAASDLERLGLYRPAPGAAGGSREAAASAWERGTWPVSRVAELARQRRRGGRRGEAAALQRVARALQGVAVLVLVFVGAMLARWGLQQLWPGLGSSPSSVPLAGDAAQRGAAPPAPQAPAASPGAEVMGGGPSTPALPGLPAGERTGEPGPASAAPQGTAPPAPPATALPGPGEGGEAAALQRYRVQPGDTLWGIARRFYGDPAAYRWLAEVNGLDRPQRLLPGQELWLPPREGSPPGRK